MKDLPIKHVGTGIFRFSLIVSVGYQIGGPMERQGNWLTPSRSSTRCCSFVKAAPPRRTIIESAMAPTLIQEVPD
jgi:hypothetical protein